MVSPSTLERTFRERNRERNLNMGGRGRVMRASLGLGAVFFMGFIWFLFVGVLASRVTRPTTTITIHESTAKSDELLKLIATQRHAGHWDFDPNYESKRRVPNGPDPIHNREAGKTREPPGRV